MPSHCAGRSTAATTFVLDTVRIPEQAHGVGQAVTDSRHPRTRGLAELVKVMARLGLSASATARLVGIARSSLHGILHQESLPSLRTAQKMSATLGIRVEWWSQAARQDQCALCLAGLSLGAGWPSLTQAGHVSVDES